MNLSMSDPVHQDTTKPLVISLVVVFLITITTIVAGYFHGNMHLLTTLKNAHS